ncbi:MAG: hypothetical protein L0K01_11310 [Brachybacterium sp.]|nr:hypothetical protein [Brachybacterium sp.]
MSITRPRLAFEDHFTQAPNRWVRDGRLSLKARGLLVPLLAHREGWRVSAASLAAVNPEGKDAIRAALLELSRHGYLVRSDEQPHAEDGTFSSYDYELADPWADQPQAENPPTVSPAETPHKRRSAPLAGYPHADNPTPKKTIPSEDQRTPTPHSPPAGGEQAELLAAPETPAAADGYPDAFEDAWAAWPKRRSDSAGKKAAHTAWRRAVVGSAKRKPRTTAGAILDAVKAYAADPNLPPEQYMPNLTTWLNGDRWENGPLPARNGGGGRPAAGDTHRAMERSLTASERYRQLEENGYQPPQQQAPQIEGRRTA